MSDLPGSTPEITTIPKIENPPQVENPNIDSVRYTENDSGGQPIEKEKAEPLSEFAFFLRNINEGFRMQIGNKVNADGVFLDTESELNAVANYNQWLKNRTLPDINSTDENTLRTTTTQFETILEEIKQGIPDTNGNPQYLHFADIEQIKTYFIQKYPIHTQRIETAFENFFHDINLFNGGITAGFSADKELRDEHSEYRKSTMLLWQEELIELVAQELEQKSVEKEFNPEEKALEVKEVFDIVSKDKNANFKININRDPISAPQATDIKFYGNPLDIKRVVKNLLRYAQDQSINKKGQPIEQTISFYKDAKKRLAIVSTDTAGGFVNGNEKLLESVNAENSKRPDLIRQKAFNRKEKGINSSGSGFGLDMVWDIVVNKYNGNVVAENVSLPNKIDGRDTTGALFSMIIPPHEKPQEQIKSI